MGAEKMTEPSKKLAESLDILSVLQKRGIKAIRSRQLTRIHRERLVKNGFLLKVMKGWYTCSRPEDKPSDSTAWYTSYWDFCADYFGERFGKNWCLSPEQSISLHAENRTVPHQLIVRSPKAQNTSTVLLHNTTIFEFKNTLIGTNEIVEKDGLRIYSISSALVSCSLQFFKQNPIDIHVALNMIKDASELLRHLLSGGHSTIASRLAGAYRMIGREQMANEIKKTMQASGFSLRENKPFENKISFSFINRIKSPYVHRLRLMWQAMRQTVLNYFPTPPDRPVDIDSYLNQVEEIYVTDAYHSLSIEGYRVSKELIERIRTGEWNPEVNENDREERNALAAKGYWEAYQTVCNSVCRVLEGEEPGYVAESDYREWYRNMFAPSVTAGLLKPVNLAGYRNGPVYIRNSRYVPPRYEAVRDLMPVLFDLLTKETEPAVRVVLGHFVFVYIHPYMDGNGRLGRFMMNVMMAAGGYPWTVIPVEKRSTYMAALEEASVRQNIVSFTEFLADLVKQ